MKANRDRQKSRLLKLLEKGAGKSASFSLAENAWTIIWQERHHRFPAALLKTCRAEGLIDETEGFLQLTAEGSACLKRILFPDRDCEYPSGARHSGVTKRSVSVEGNIQQVLYNEHESPLSRLYTRQDKNGRSWLSETEFQAGERLRLDFERSQLQPRISANWIASVASSGRGMNKAADFSDFATDAKKQVEQAVAALGQDLSGIALDVCCFLKGLETVERERSWPPRSAKLMLRTALRELVRHYGLETRRKGSSIQSWGTSDFRPQI